MAVARQFGAIDEEIKIAEHPGYFVHCWEIFQDLIEEKHFDGMSGLYQPTTSLEMLAWSVLEAQPLSLREVRLIKKLMRIFHKEDRAAAARRSKTPDKSGKSKK